MASKKPDRVAEVLREIEALAKRLRTELRRAARETGLTKRLQVAAATLRKRAALAAAQVERYAHELRMELAGKSMKRPAVHRRRA
jgi:hypothetical protein